MSTEHTYSTKKTGETTWNLLRDGEIVAEIVKDDSFGRVMTGRIQVASVRTASYKVRMIAGVTYTSPAARNTALAGARSLKEARTDAAWILFRER